MQQPATQIVWADVRSNSLPRHHHGEAWRRGARRFGRLHAATSILNCVRGLLCTGQAPGTTQLCKCLFPEEVDLPIGFKADLLSLGNELQSEFADLFGQK